MTGAPGGLTKEALNQIIQMQPGTESAARAFFLLAELQLEVDGVEISIATYRNVPPAWPVWHARAGFAIGKIYEIQQADAQAAIREYRKVISLHPESMSAAQSYSCLAQVYGLSGDPVSGENMRDCSMRTWERLAQAPGEKDDKEEALYQFGVAARELQRWDRATEAFDKCRRRAEPDRKAEIDWQVGLLLLEKDQPAEALVSFKECLERAKRQGELRTVVDVTRKIVVCQSTAADDAGVKKTLRGLVEWVHRSKSRLSEAQLDPDVAPALVRSYLRLDRLADAKTLRTRLRRFKSDGARAVLAIVEELVGEAESAQAG